MDDLKRSYMRRCQERGSEPQEAVLRQLQDTKESAGRGRLNLSAQSLSVESCEVLGVLFQNDVTFTHVDLSDCMLSEEGRSKLLLQGFCNNSTIKVLDLKGNNLRAEGAEALGKLLRHNSSLTSLTLEWNSLGMLEDAFSMLCDGLSFNQTLQKLDLRNNQISHTGAEELALALKRNVTLQELDLRWNNIGLLGGRAMLSCMETNRSLLKLELSGNNIPSDVLKAIEQAVEHNQERQMMKRDNVSQRQILTKEVQSLKQEKNKQVRSFFFFSLEDLVLIGFSRRPRLGNWSRLSRRPRLGNWRPFADIVSLCRLQMTEANLALSQQKAQDLGELLSHAKRTSTTMREKQAKELRKEKEVWTRERDLRSVEELERRCKAQQEQLFDLKQELTDTTAELKLRAMQAEGKRYSSWESLHVFHDRYQGPTIPYCHSLCIPVMPGPLYSEEQQQHSAVLQDKLRTIAQSRDQAQNQILQQQQQTGELQAQNNQLGLEIECLKRRIDGLNQELAKREQQKMAEVTKARVELQERIGHLEAELTAQEGLKEKICSLERQLKAQSSSHREMMLDKEGEISSLTEKLRLKAAEILRMREEDAQRANLLQNAILSYIHSSPLNSTAGRK
uniref:Leucine rich repeat containing 45 n=1 Tax=Leptobrachium leishanense TaxID=445787 RepID=A0A8C5WFK0_9ANUR